MLQALINCGFDEKALAHVGAAKGFSKHSRRAAKDDRSVYGVLPELVEDFVACRQASTSSAPTVFGAHSTHCGSGSTAKSATCPSHRGGTAPTKKADRLQSRATAPNLDRAQALSPRVACRGEEAKPSPYGKLVPQLAFRLTRTASHCPWVMPVFAVVAALV